MGLGCRNHELVTNLDELVTNPMNPNLNRKVNHNLPDFHQLQPEQRMAGDVIFPQERHDSD